ncbi:unnamed protein product, partial [Mesorhabditis spiculigera]
MPIEVRATLDRQVPVYLAGETVVVSVVLTNCKPAGERGHSETIAWGSVQLSSERTNAKARNQKTQLTTSIPRSNTCVYSSVPSILFCDINVLPGDSKTYTYEVQLPLTGLLPSFRGNLVRFQNRITVAVQHLKSPIKMIHLPIRLVPDVGIESRKPICRNPFLDATTSAPPIAEMFAATVDQITAPKKEFIYQMTNSRGRVAALMLYKRAFKLGEDVVGKLSFQVADVRCYQWLVRLVSLESLVETDPSAEKPSSTIVWATQHKISADFAETAFRVPIALDAPPTFSNDIVHIKWQLQFEFVTSSSYQPAAALEDIRPTNAPVNVDIETLSWQVDLFVLSCSPFNIALTDTSANGETMVVI